MLNGKKISDTSNRHHIHKAKDDPELLDMSGLRLLLAGSKLDFGLPRAVREAIVEISDLRNKEFGHCKDARMPRETYEMAMGKIFAFFRRLRVHQCVDEEVL